MGRTCSIQGLCGEREILYLQRLLFINVVVPPAKPARLTLCYPGSSLLPPGFDLSLAMATISASLAVAAPSCAPADTLSKSFSGLKPSTLFAPKCANPLAISNGSRVNAMLVWQPYNNKRFETLSYLPPLNNDQIAKQVEYMTRKGWTPCIEFDQIGSVYREHFHGSGYYDGRYWIMWKLPMFGCTDSAAVLREIAECAKQFPKAFIRVLGFDAKRQVQVAGFLVQKPSE